MKKILIILLAIVILAGGTIGALWGAGVIFKETENTPSPSPSVSPSPSPSTTPGPSISPSPSPNPITPADFLNKFNGENVNFSADLSADKTSSGLLGGNQVTITYDITNVIRVAGGQVYSKDTREISGIPTGHEVPPEVKNGTTIIEQYKELSAYYLKIDNESWKEQSNFPDFVQAIFPSIDINDYTAENNILLLNQDKLDKNLLKSFKIEIAENGTAKVFVASEIHGADFTIVTETIINVFNIDNTIVNKPQGI